MPANQNVFNETIYANKFKREIRILENNEGQYEAIFKKGTFVSQEFIKQPVLREVI